MLKSVCVSLLSLCAIVGHVESGALMSNPCTRSGFFPLVDNTPIYYGCYNLPSGGYQLRYLECLNGDIFSSQFGRCVPVAVTTGKARDGSDIENPTIPPVATTTSANHHADNEDDDDSTSTSEETVAPPATTESSTTESSSEETPPETTEPSTEPTPEESSTSSTASTESSVVTEEPVEPTEPSTSVEPAEPTEPTTANPEEPTDPTEETSTDATVIPTTDAPVTEAYECIASGFFARENCKDFYYCVNFEGKLTAFDFTCPDGQLFNEESKFCDATTTCATAPVESSVDSLRLLRQEFECEVQGAYPYPGDCSKYYACSWDARNNGFLARAVKCPEGKVFDTLAGQCSVERANTCQGR